MHHYIHAAACRLICGKSVGELGVHYRKFALAVVAVERALEHILVIGDNRAVAHFAAGGRYGKHGSHRSAALADGLADVKVPHVAVIFESRTDGLAGVDDAAAADGKDEVNAFLFAQVDALIDEGEMRIGDDAAKLDMRDVRRVEGRFDLVEQAAAPVAYSTRSLTDL